MFVITASTLELTFQSISARAHDLSTAWNCPTGYHRSFCYQEKALRNVCISYGRYLSYTSEILEQARLKNMDLLLKRRMVVLLLLSSCLCASCGPETQTANRPDRPSLDVVLMLTMHG